MLRQGIIAVLMLLVAAAWIGPTQAQDAHYWNLQYGTRAELLGGAVIGSKVGLSNTYYNPGALGLLERPSLVLSSLALELTSIRLPQEPPQEDIRSTRLSAVPNFVAGTLWFKVLGGSQLAYSFLTRQDFDVRLTLRAQTQVPGAGTDPDTLRSGEILREENVNENWVGITWSRALADGLGIGATGYVAYRGQRSRAQLVGQESVLAGPGVAAHLIDTFDYWHVRTLAKLGVLFERDDYSLGITATTPSLGIMGSGSVFTSIYDPILTPLAPLSAANYQQDLSPDYQSEWTVGGGVSYQYKQTRLHASVEWFQAISQREVLPAQPAPSSIGGAFNNSAIQELDSVTNYGVGVEHNLSASTQLFVSYITNYSALPEKTAANMAVATWDIYQLTGGGNFTIGGVEFTLGLEYGFGNNTVERLGIAGAEDAGLVAFETGQQEVRFRRLEGFLGFTFLFGDDPNAKPSQTLGQSPSGG